MSADEFTIEDIEDAFQKHYREPTNNKVTQFLNRARRSKYAWSFSVKLLAQDKPMSIQIYAAETLRYKIENDWDQHHINDLNYILGPLIVNLNREVALVSRICRCIASFIVQAGPDYPELIAYFIRCIESEDDEMKKNSYLAILTLVPKQFRNLTGDKKREIRRMLKHYSSAIFDLINNLLQDESNQESVKNEAIKCFKKWLSINASVFNGEGQHLVYFIFDLLQKPSYFTSSAEALKKFFERFDPLQGHRQPLMSYMQKVVKLSDLFDSESDDIDVVHSLTEVIVSAVKNNCKVLLFQFNTYNKLGSKLLDLVLKTINVKGQYPTEEYCSNLSFGFWSRLHTNLEKETYPYNIKNVFGEKILELFDIMLIKTKYPNENEYNNWEADDKEKFKCYRQEFSAIAASFSTFLGCQPIKQMLNKLSNLCDRHRNGTEIEWQEFESIFYLMTSIVGVELDCTDRTKIYDLLLDVPCLHNTLRKQITIFLGSYAEQTDYDMLEYSIDFILESLRISETSSAAIMSLNALLSHKKDRIFLVKDVIQGLKEYVDAGYLKTSDYSLLAKCLVYLLPLMAEDEALNLIQAFLMPQFDDLINANSNMISNQNKNNFVRKLKMLAVFFAEFSFSKEETVDSSHFIFRFLEQLFPGIKQVISLNLKDENIMGKLFDMLQKALISLRCYSHIVSSRYRELVSTAYITSPSLSVLELAWCLFVITSQNEQLESITQSSCERMKERLLMVLKRPFEVHPALLEEFLHAFLSILWEARTANSSCQSEFILRFSSTIIDEIVYGGRVNDLPWIILMTLLKQDFDLTKVVEAREGRRLLEEIVFAILKNMSTNNIKVLASIVKSLLVRHFAFVENTLNEILFERYFLERYLSIRERRQLFCILITPAKGRINVERQFVKFRKICRNLPSETLEVSDESGTDHSSSNSD